LRSRRTSWTAFAIAAGSAFAITAPTAWPHDLDKPRDFTRTTPAAARPTDRAASPLVHRDVRETGISNDWIRTGEDRAQDPTKFPPRVQRKAGTPAAAATTGLERAHDRANTNADQHESDHPNSAPPAAKAEIPARKRDHQPPTADRRPDGQVAEVGRMSLPAATRPVAPAP
jgi:hypothetical protein